MLRYGHVTSHFSTSRSFKVPHELFYWPKVNEPE